jgi:hypothetical protein
MSANADTSAPCDESRNTIPGESPVDSAPMNCGHQSEGFEFADGRADCRTFQTAALSDVGLCGRCDSIPGITEQAKPDSGLPGFQLLQCAVDEFIQHSESLSGPLRSALSAAVPPVCRCRAPGRSVALGHCWHHRNTIQSVASVHGLTSQSSAVRQIDATSKRFP